MTKRRSLYWLTSVFSLLVLSMFIVACGGVTPGAEEIPSPTPTPTPTPTTLSYDNALFTISYPREWQKKDAPNVLGEQVLFSRDEVTNISVQYGATTDTAAGFLDKLYAGAKTISPDATKDSLPDQVTYGSYTYTQMGLTGTRAGKKVKVLMLFLKNPKDPGKYFVVGFSATVDQYDEYFTKYFKPSVESFKVK